LRKASPPNALLQGTAVLRVLRELRVLRAELFAPFQDARRPVESSIREIESHDEEFSDLESRLDDVEDSSNSFEARIDSLVEENASLRVSIDELTARVNRSETPRRAKRCRAKSAASATVTSAECDTTTLDGTK
jgi:septal ring factor EnvC (AmiA/AmiB activator)